MADDLAVIGVGSERVLAARIENAAEELHALRARRSGGRSARAENQGKRTNGSRLDDAVDELAHLQA